MAQECRSWTLGETWRFSYGWRATPHGLLRTRLVRILETRKILSAQPHAAPIAHPHLGSIHPGPRKNHSGASGLHDTRWSRQLSRHSTDGFFLALGYTNTKMFGILLDAACRQGTDACWRSGHDF